MKDMGVPASSPATIKDVAAHAGVSVATVSAVINRNKYVNRAVPHCGHPRLHNS